MSPLRAVLFDLGGTLWPEVQLPRSVYVRKLRAALPGLSRRQGSELLERLVEVTGAMLQSSRQDTLADIAAALRQVGVSSDIDTADRVRRSLFIRDEIDVPLLPGAHDLLRHCAERGQQVAIVSNSFWCDAADYWDDLAHWGVAAYVNLVVTSVETGVRKPDPAIFKGALEKLRLEPGDCAMVGDSETKDVLPAAAMGMRTIRVSQDPDPTSAATQVALSLAQVDACVRAWSAQT